jgi:hypothetical protein
MKDPSHRYDPTYSLVVMAPRLSITLVDQRMRDKTGGWLRRRSRSVAPPPLFVSLLPRSGGLGMIEPLSDRAIE